MKLTESKASDRAEMARRIDALAREFGFVCECMKTPRGGLHVDVATLHGLHVGIDLQRDAHAPNVFVVPWYVRGSDALLAKSFGLIAGGDVNPHHFCKCTAVAYGWDALMTRLRDAFEAVKDGSAFQPVKPPPVPRAPHPGGSKLFPEAVYERILKTTYARIQQDHYCADPPQYARPGVSMKQAIGRMMGALKRAKQVPEVRGYPKWHPGMTTSQYVTSFYALNEELCHFDPRTYLHMPDRAAPFNSDEHEEHEEHEMRRAA